MPIPKPRKDEEQKAFMERCMGDSVMNREYPDAKQRYAICSTSWKDKKNADADEFGLIHGVDFAMGCTICLDSSKPYTVHANNEDEDILIDGWFTTEKQNAYDQIVKASSFAWDGGLARFNGRVMGFHDNATTPVGVAESIKIVKNKGLHGRIRIFKENDALLKRAIRTGVLNALSIGFNVKEYSFDTETEVWTFTKCELLEVSLCNIGANDEATFKVLHDLKLNLISNPTNERSAIVPLSEKEKDTLIKLSDFDPNAVKSKQEALEQNLDSLKKIQNTLTEQCNALKEGNITKSEFTERMERIHADITKIRADIEIAKNANNFDSNKVVYHDFRSLITDHVWLTNEDGTKATEMAQRGFCLFQMPVDYKSLNAGEELKNLRDLYDAVLMVDAVMRHRLGTRHDIRNLKLYKTLVAKTAMFDKELSHAMAGGNTGYGAEWLPTEMSSEFSEILRVVPNLPNKFQTWQMPTGASSKYPFQNGKAVVYKGSEAIVNNPSEARKTNIATGAKTFTPEVFIGALVSSEELSEDSIRDMVAMIRKELAVALSEGLESAIINGDDSATHMDNAHTSTYIPSYDIRTCFQGLRKLGVANAVTATNGVGGMTFTQMTDAQALLGVAGLRPAECLFVTGIKGRGQMLQALFDATNAYGILQYMVSGVLPDIAGVSTYISGMHEENLDADGYYNAGSSKYTSIELVHLPSCRIGQRRGITLEFAKNILTQQQAFVASARWDFGKICADSITPIASIIQVEHTA